MVLHTVACGISVFLSTTVPWRVDCVPSQQLFLYLFCCLFCIFMLTHWNFCIFDHNSSMKSWLGPQPATWSAPTNHAQAPSSPGCPGICWFYWYFYFHLSLVFLPISRYLMYVFVHIFGVFHFYWVSRYMVSTRPLCVFWPKAPDFKGRVSYF